MRVILTGFLTAGLIACFGQVSDSIFSRIDRKDLKRYVKILSSDSLAGRGTGTLGQQRAEQFIASRFQSLGLLPFDLKSYSEKFTLTETYWGEVYLQASERVLRNFQDVIFLGTGTQNEELKKDVVFGGYGTEAELDQIDVRDRFVFVFLPNLRADYDIRQRLKKRNAFGVILANPENERQFESIKKTLQDHVLQKRVFLPSVDTLLKQTWLDSLRIVNSFLISNAQVHTVMGVSIKQLQQVALQGNLREIPFASIQFKYERIHKKVETANVVGLIRGESDTSIVITAHYDHLGNSEDGYFPGADDNASGVAALLEIAEAYASVKNLKYGILFLATSAEEAGLLGSEVHVNNPKFNSAQVACVLNLDMISRIDNKHKNGRYLYCLGVSHFQQLLPVLKKADTFFEKPTFDFSLDRHQGMSSLYTRSDQYNFYKKGIPALHFFSGFHDDYHKPTDTIDKIDFSILEDRVRLISQVIRILETEGLKN